MVYELRDTLCAEDGEPPIAQESTPRAVFITLEPFLLR
jgi:hypothetical protein